MILLFTAATVFVFYKFYLNALSDGANQGTQNILSQMNLTRISIENSSEVRDHQKIVSNLGIINGTVAVALIDFNGGIVRASSRNAYIDKHSRILNRIVEDFEKHFSNLKNGQCQSINDVQFICQLEIWTKPKLYVPGRNLKEELLHLVVVYDISDFLSKARVEFLYHSIFGLLATLLLSIGLFVILKWSILNRISLLVTATEKWAQGEKETRIPISNKDELSLLGSALNDLMDSLKDYENKFTLQQASVVHKAQLVALGEMAAGVAHEINNPLTIIAGKAQLLDRVLPLEIKSDDRIKKSLDSILQTVQRISKIVNALRAYSRTSPSDKLELVSINQLIEDALALCQERFRASGVAIKYEEQGGLYVLGKDIQLIQVIVNLLNNSYDAVKNLEAKWILIETNSKNDQIEIKITDSGKGISSEIADKIMQPFFTTKPLGEGTGIGLSISKGIIEDHGGSLTLNQNSTHTCFVIRLPLQEANAKVA